MKIRHIKNLILIVSLIISLPLYAASSLIDSMPFLSQGEEGDPFFDFTWETSIQEIGTIKFYASEYKENESELGETLQRSMIDNSRGRAFYERNQESFVRIYIYNEHHTSKKHTNEEEKKREVLYGKLLQLSGFQWKKEIVASEPGYSRYRMYLDRVKDSPDEFDRALFRKATLAPELKEKLSEPQRRHVYSLALARALLHDEYIHSVYYLLQECDPNANLSEHVYATTSFKKGSVPSLLHVCVLSPWLVQRHSTGLQLGLSHEINELIKKDANRAVKDSEGMTPIDLLSKRLECLGVDLASLSDSAVINALRIPTSSEDVGN